LEQLASFLKVIGKALPQVLQQLLEVVFSEDVQGELQFVQESKVAYEGLLTYASCPAPVATGGCELSL